MGIRLKDIKRSSFMAQQMRHPFIVLPPNLANIYLNAVAGTTFNSIGPITLLATSIRTAGWPTAISVQANGTWISGRSLTILIVGRDEFYEPISESITITGTGAAQVTVFTNAIFSTIESATVTATTGNLVGTETLSMGCGDATTPANIRIINPCPSVPFANIRILAQAAVPATSAVVVVSQVLQGGRVAVLDYTNSAGATSRFGLLIVRESDPKLYEEQ